MSRTGQMSENPQRNPQRRRAVVTGGSGGIGSLIVRKLLQADYEVLVLSRHAPALTDVRLRHISCDLSNGAETSAVGKAIAGEGTPVDVLIHCAGTITPGMTESLEESDIQRQIAVNFTAPVVLTSALLSTIRKGGGIVFVNSLAAVYPLAESSVYAASKAALRSFALALTIEARARDIAVSSVFPGAVDTPMLHAEMCGGGSVLNFVNAPATPEKVADLVMHALTRKGGEYFYPALDGVFGRWCMVWPRLLRIVLPLLTRLGRIGAAKYRNRTG